MLNQRLSNHFLPSKKESSWQKFRLTLRHMAQGKRKLEDCLVLGLLVVLFSTFALLPLFFQIQFHPHLTTCAWLTFGLGCVWVGGRLKYILHPERLAYQQVIETYGQIIRETSDQNLLLNRITRTLYQTLKLESLSVWRYDSESNILALSRFTGPFQAGDLSELPLDLGITQLHGTWLVSAMPESALRQGLIRLGVQVITSLSLGDELVGIIALRNKARRGEYYSPETLQWLNLMAGQLALAVKNAYLITDLEETLTQLQLAYRRTIDAEEEERRHLAVELHDDILTRLTTMSLTLRNCHRYVADDPTQVQSWLAALEEETLALNRRLREITQGLHPSVLTDLGLILALQAYTDLLAKQASSTSPARTVALTAQGFNGARLSEPKLERDLYNITRQALDNALTHTQAQQIFIHLGWRENAVTVTVQDTGCGMADTPERLMGRNGCLGLLSMHERALAWQGRLTFHSTPNQGTVVHAVIPIAQPSPTPTHLQTFTQYLG